MPVKYEGILKITFGIYTRCQKMNVIVRCSEFECRKEKHLEIQLGSIAKNAT